MVWLLVLVLALSRLGWVAVRCWAGCVFEPGWGWLGSGFVRSVASEGCTYGVTGSTGVMDGGVYEPAYEYS